MLSLTYLSTVTLFILFFLTLPISPSSSLTSFLKHNKDIKDEEDSKIGSILVLVEVELKLSDPIPSMRLYGKVSILVLVEVELKPLNSPEALVQLTISSFFESSFLIFIYYYVIISFYQIMVIISMDLKNIDTSSITKFLSKA